MKNFNLVIIFALSFNINGQIAAGQNIRLEGTIYETEGISGKARWQMQVLQLKLMDWDS